ncbi:MAG: alanine--tRNA ligase [Candidatus Buchananbacteria bacterium RIFCSPHIGHO2_02_FULL_40_13]|uniref:Alanine--tRNA ligase n=1 Tax=Candidatus Buchananbacteria bacterium RIFCSPLOWO2_01_FULL_39_33 TaxID=1797543 RepID=A0A1G1YK32_9BACT|nr:MAG: alanine--tRNA ligase [Candidatus Buchananbacteria bacterium RIFCSPHIGHO2_01_FULL_40_35]OGY50711.1 MAG: alanine--tRNA ligase [Candidatus Buchananbacteria bacterium RIFCSPHIGHO2_02_FULL_40_13]OGY52641.1 MAG: alanine--tRNA ligase [Candidatus Buchananbacteria bacterium RIFCSPLOWO2_01_FULL_39_33]
MTTKELKEKYLTFFERRNHKLISGASLLPTNDPTVLFTTAGMHPLVPYLLGEKHPAGQRLVNIQKCIRTGDIDQVGDAWHLTFFEMLGNWSLGDYFKPEAITMSFDFLTQELGIPVEKLAVSCFEGEEKNNIPPDDESAKIWQSLGLAKGRIAFLGRSDNWWGPAGQTGPCGPDTEMFYWTGNEPVPENFDPANDHNWVEIWNDVFMQYNKTADGQYEELKQKNVDTGLGLERTAAVLSHLKSVYDIEPLSTIVLQITSLMSDLELAPEYVSDLNLADQAGLETEKTIRIIADHLRAATFILAEGIEPSNVEQGYVLRRLIRRAIRYGQKLGLVENFTPRIAEVVIDKMGGFYKELRTNRDFIISQLAKEEEKFNETLKKGLKELEKIGQNKKVSGSEAFKLFTTYGFPYEMTVELAKERGWEVAEKEYQEEFSKHREISRQGSSQKFKGGLADQSIETTSLHTAAHLLLAALRRVLGNHVYQKGSNITAERLRFDFSHPDKLTDEQKKRVEDLVNEQIAKDLPVTIEELTVAEAKKRGAMGVFEARYGEKVKVYSIGDSVPGGQVFSQEICGGPHATQTGELGHFKIQKEESSSSGVRRIKAILE